MVLVVMLLLLLLLLVVLLVLLLLLLLLLVVLVVMLLLLLLLLLVEVLVVAMLLLLLIVALLLLLLIVALSLVFVVELLPLLSLLCLLVVLLSVQLCCRESKTATAQATAEATATTGTESKTQRITAIQPVSITVQCYGGGGDAVAVVATADMHNFSALYIATFQLPFLRFVVVVVATAVLYNATVVNSQRLSLNSYPNWPKSGMIAVVNCVVIVSVIVVGVAVGVIAVVFSSCQHLVITFCLYGLPQSPSTWLTYYLLVGLLVGSWS